MNSITGGTSEGALTPSRLPIVPQSGKNMLGSDEGGRPQWSNVDDLYERLNEVESKFSEIESRLNSASIDAGCQNGTVIVTLTL